MVQPDLGVADGVARARTVCSGKIPANITSRATNVTIEMNFFIEAPS